MWIFRLYFFLAISDKSERGKRKEYLSPSANGFVRMLACFKVALNIHKLKLSRAKYKREQYQLF